VADGVSTKILHVVGARPNYMKVAPLVDALRSVSDLKQVLLDTGQHYDEVMARVFLKDLSLPVPDRSLAVGSGSHAVQTAKVMIGFETVCLEEKPDLVVVVGDVNSTVAAALVAAKLRIPCAHVEAGLRSFDRAMPEEINRLVTDQLADILLTPSAEANDNLRREGIPAERIHLVGNIMIDTLMRYRPVAGFERVAGRFGISERAYAVLTLHRPSNVDDRDAFVSIAAALRTIGETMPVVFPVHPRTRARIAAFDLGPLLDRILLTEPLGYLDFLSLMSHAAVVLTDSGGMQEETTVLGIPCLTLRENTERPITLTEGTNRLVGTDPAAILEGFQAALGQPPRGRMPALWDGQAAVRIVKVLQEFLS
jgi:UDP-N-acetylglucosamine 2-epimerase (non-hydrolysing)